MRFGVALKRCEHASLWGMVAYVVIPDLRCSACTEFNRSEPVEVFRDLLMRISLQIRFFLLLPIAQSLRSKRPHSSMPISLVYNFLQIYRCYRVVRAAEVADNVQVLVLAAEFLQVLERERGKSC